MVLQSIYAALTAVNDGRTLRIWENYDFLSAERMVRTADEISPVE